jgi:hypothetical protein
MWFKFFTKKKGLSFYTHRNIHKQYIFHKRGLRRYIWYSNLLQEGQFVVSNLVGATFYTPIQTNLQLTHSYPGSKVAEALLWQPTPI